MDRSNQNGIYAEQLAARYLTSIGYTLLENRYRCRQGEIDLVLSKDGYLVFCEVKFRKDLRHGYPAEAVDRPKIKRIQKAAEHYLSKHGLSDRRVRFDVLSLVKHNGRYYVRLEENAFGGY